MALSFRMGFAPHARAAFAGMDRLGWHSSVTVLSMTPLYAIRPLDRKHQKTGSNCFTTLSRETPTTRLLESGGVGAGGVAPTKKGCEIAALRSLEFDDHCVSLGRVGGDHQRQQRAY